MFLGSKGQPKIDYSHTQHFVIYLQVFSNRMIEITAVQKKLLDNVIYFQKRSPLRVFLKYRDKNVLRDENNSNELL